MYWRTTVRPPLLVFGRSTLKAQRTAQAKQTAGLISKMLRSVSKLRLSGHPGQPNSFEDSMSARGVVRFRGAEPGCFTLDEPTMFSCHDFPSKLHRAFPKVNTPLLMFLPKRLGAEIALTTKGWTGMDLMIGWS